VHGCSNWHWAASLSSAGPLDDSDKFNSAFALTGLNLAKFYFKFLLHFTVYSNFRVILNFTFSHFATDIFRIFIFLGYELFYSPEAGSKAHKFFRNC